MIQMEKLEKRNYGKKNHEVSFKAHIDTGLEERINMSLDKLNVSPYMKLKKGDFFRLALEQFCASILSNQFEIGLTFKIKGKKVLQ